MYYIFRIAIFHSHDLNIWIIANGFYSFLIVIIFCKYKDTRTSTQFCCVLKECSTFFALQLQTQFVVVWYYTFLGSNTKQLQQYRCCIFARNSINEKNKLHSWLKMTLLTKYQEIEQRQLNNTISGILDELDANIQLPTQAEHGNQFTNRQDFPLSFYDFFKLNLT